MEADMKTYTVYCHTSPSGRKYIGITSTHVNRRWGNGNGYKSNPYFWRAIQKYGWDNISHEILLDGLTVCEAKAKEEYLISTMNLTDRKFGYNIRGGGDGSFSEESRRKMSVARMGNKNCAGNILSSKTKQMISASLVDYYKIHDNPFNGRRHSQATIERLKSIRCSEHTRQLMRENHADVNGIKNPSARVVSQFTLDGVFVETYAYAKKAAKRLNVDLSSIIKCCRGKAKTCGGFVWKYGQPGVYGWEEVT